MKITIAVISVMLAIVGCSHSIHPDQRDQVRQHLNDTAELSIQQLLDEELVTQAQLDESLGYFVGEMSTTKAPVIGGGQGLGLLYEAPEHHVSYMNIDRYDLGFGLGSNRYRFVTLFNEQSALDRFKHDGWDQALVAEFNLGDSGSALGTSNNLYKENIDIHYLADSGAALTSSARLINISTNYDLSDSGVSDLSLPNKGYAGTQHQSNGAREWDRALPFLAQEVINKGYDLPLPYGLSIIYADVFQEMKLTDLEIGFDGSDKVAIDFVSFSDSSSHNQAPQLKLDAWLFPFMNVFATLGRVEGEAKLTIDLEGNGLLNGLEELDKINCSQIPKPLLCRSLEDRDISVPIKVDFHGMSYGLGTILAGGWNNYFVAIPLSITYANMSNSDTDGLVFNASPRVGHLFSLGHYGTFSAYVGAAYLDSSLTITGTHYFKELDMLESVDYKIKQENSDKWMGLIGANYDFNKYWSMTAEYGGFVGSREQFIASLNRRF